MRGMTENVHQNVWFIKKTSRMVQDINKKAKNIKETSDANKFVQEVCKDYLFVYVVPLYI